MSFARKATVPASVLFCAIAISQESANSIRDACVRAISPMVVSSLQYGQGRTRDVTWAHSTSSECVRVREARRRHDGAPPRDQKNPYSASSVCAFHRRGVEGTCISTSLARSRNRTPRTEHRVVDRCKRHRASLRASDRHNRRGDLMKEGVSRREARPLVEGGGARRPGR